MLLAVDVGNTHTVIGMYVGENRIADWRITTRKERTADELGVLITNLFQSHGAIGAPTVTRAIVSSVVPALTDTVVRMVRQLFDVRCRIVGPGLKTGMPIRYEDPREVGADRIVNAVSAYARHQSGLIIVDFGTATTFDVVSPKGEYLGGAICPGIGISSEALFHHAARLPRVEFARPSQVVGRNTVSSIQSGLVFGYVSMIEGMVKRIETEIDFPCSVGATGGLASNIARETEIIDWVDEWLTLDGLRVLSDLNP
ncbi:MAG: type III pantothenate kinase [Myxococcota bacterium]|nr:type III pantothenate kinase [Myxococcota bacterium]